MVHQRTLHQRTPGYAVAVHPAGKSTGTPSIQSSSPFNAVQLMNGQSGATGGITSSNPATMQAIQQGSMAPAPSSATIAPLPPSALQPMVQPTTQQPAQTYVAPQPSMFDNIPWIPIAIAAAATVAVIAVVHVMTAAPPAPAPSPRRSRTTATSKVGSAEPAGTA